VSDTGSHIYRFKFRATYKPPNKIYFKRNLIKLIDSLDEWMIIHNNGYFYVLVTSKVSIFFTVFRKLDLHA